jgi:uncharacterized protein YndB with AHSA1/START domain
MVAAAKTGSATVTTPSDREVRITRLVDAPSRLVWQAWTDPKHIPQWMTGPEGWTMPVCEMDLRVGGTWRYVWRKSDGAEMEMTGLVKEVTPPVRMVTTERWGPEWPETVNTLELAESGDQTTVSITILYPSKADRDAALQTPMADGMEQSFVRLERLIGNQR